MSEFIDMLDPRKYAESNIVPMLRDGSLTRDSLRKRLVHLNQLFLAVERGFRQCAAEQAFVETKVPSIVSTIGACENWQTLFKVDHDSSFFHLLAQTGQLFLEGALSHHERVSCVTKSFRKEALEDQRHLVEFTLLEIEGAFTFHELLDFMRRFFRAMCLSVIETLPKESGDALGLDFDYVRSLAAAPIIEVSYTACVQSGFAPAIQWGDDLDSSLEQRVVQDIGKGQPVLVTRFPKAIKFFNMAEDREDPQKVLSVDLVLPTAGESAGGAQREDDPSRLKQRLLDSAMYAHHIRAGGTYDDFAPYVDMVERKLTPVHSGCGFGTERILQCMLRHDDIRMCSVDYLTRMLYAWDALKLGRPRPA